MNMFVSCILQPNCYVEYNNSLFDLHIEILICLFIISQDEFMVFVHDFMAVSFLIKYYYYNAYVFVLGFGSIGVKVFYL